MNRQSLAPPLAQRRRTTLATSSLKSRQLSYLNAQLAQMKSNLLDMSNHLQVTLDQAEYIRRLGILHGALFMATHRVFEQEDLETQDFEDEVEVDEEETT